MVRRYLGFSVDEWDRLPWWQQRLYVEELDAELSGPDQGDGQSSDEALLAAGFRIE
ncbi:hypothetical protein [Saccharopolyspora pogona]|uniref:hypothetical protein n=1 Tax=Saccharopolyspora pogona TaxID=333966 RepID=UPI0016878B99|nr:hypothetical protein [Saccharopolyspora pogona]